MKPSMIIPALLLSAACIFAESADQAGSQFPPPPQGQQPLPPQSANPGDFGTVPDESKPELTAKVLVNRKNSGKKLGAETLVATAADESVLVIKDGASAEAVKTVFQKSGGDVSNGGQSNFYGLNAAVVSQDGSSLLLQNVTVTTNADGANAVFSTGEGSAVTIKNIRIRTQKDSSRGLDATYGGLITAHSVDITTEGAHCAAFATDRGEGTVIVQKGTARTSGQGSPVIYSTGDIRVTGLTGMATGSEIAVIEGKNSISIEKSTLTGGCYQRENEVSAAVMLYQSMSGDANQGTSIFSAKDSSLTSTASGPFFYVTNTQAKILLTNTRITNANEVLLQATGNDSRRGWGRKGANGGSVTLYAQKQLLQGNIVVDAISDVTLTLDSGAKFTGAINAANAGIVNLTVGKKADVTLTQDSYVNQLSLEDSSYKNIRSNGFTLFYNKNEEANRDLHGRTILLPDGGKLCGIEMDFSAKEAAGGSDGEKGASEKPGKKLPLQTLTGILSLRENEVILTATDKSSYVLAVMEAPRGMDDKKMEKGMMGKPPAPPSGDMQKPAGTQPGKGQMQEPPQGKAHGEPTKHITLDDLKAYEGKQVEVKGMMLKGKFMVMQIKGV